jgi:hypothetical protein
MMRLFERTGDKLWRRHAADFVSNLLFLAKDGGFIHADFQVEPAYSNRQTCPIHQGMPILALLDYYEWSFAEPLLKEAIPAAIEKHWKWFHEAFWRKGNEQGILPHPGWCGVINQDLVIVGALARRARLLGDANLFEEFARPTLEVYLSPDRYHEKLGLFERGFKSKEGMVERTFYNGLILDMLQIILDYTGDPRLEGIIDNVSSHLFDAMITGKDGRTHLAWGANVEEGVLKGWTHGPIPMPAYPVLLPWMTRHLEKFPDKKKAGLLAELEQTLAGYVFSDGTIPTALQTENPILSVVPGSEILPFWSFLIERLDCNLKSPDLTKFVSTHRSIGDLTWKSGARAWSLERDGEPLFTGFKPNPSGIAIGTEKLSRKDFSELGFWSVPSDPLRAERLSCKDLSELHEPAAVERLEA